MFNNSLSIQYNTSTSEKNYLLGYVSCYFLLWSIVPYLVNHNLPGDLIEGLYWGHAWQWGYWKHPILSPWIVESVAQVFKKEFFLYCISPFIASCGLYVYYNIARLSLNYRAAIVATILTSLSWFYTVRLPQFNHNVILLLCWPLFIYSFLLTVQHNRLKHWLATGLTAAIAILAKYYSIILIAAACLTLLANAQYRKRLYSLKCFYALLVFCGVLFPHALWLVHHNFYPLLYVNDRLQELSQTQYLPYATAHLVYPLIFLSEQILSLSAPIVGFILIYLHYPKCLTTQQVLKNSYFKLLLFLFALPLIITVLVPILTGKKIYGMWGTPLWGLLSILLMHFINDKVTKKIIINVLLLAGIVQILTLAIYATDHSVQQIHKKHTPKTFFHGKELAKFSAAYWHTFHPQQPITVVAGDGFIAGSIAYYLPQQHRPQVFSDFSYMQSPWISFNTLNQTGTLMVWENTECRLPAALTPLQNKITHITAVPHEIIAPFNYSLCIGFM